MARRIAIETDEGATVYAHVTDDVQPETIEAFKSLGDAIARMTPERWEALRQRQQADSARKGLAGDEQMPFDPNEKPEGEEQTEGEAETPATESAEEPAAE